MKIALTGGTGFIGRHLLKELKKKQIYPVITLLPSEQTPDYLKDYNIVEVDLKNYPLDIYDALGSPDILIHLAWGGLPNYKSLIHIEEELPAQYKFIKQMISSGLKNLVVTGTCFEYGMQSGALNENQKTFPSNPYGFAKDTLRKQLEFLQMKFDFNLIWFRLFYLYGEAQSNKSLYSQLLKTVENKETIFKMSGGEQLRDYLSVEEAAAYMVSIGMSKENIGLINICSGKPISVRTLVENWIRENHWNLNLDLGYYPYPDYEPMAFWGDGRKLQQILTALNYSKS